LLALGKFEVGAEQLAVPLSLCHFDEAASLSLYVPTNLA